MSENGLVVARDFAGYLLIRNPNGWKIAAQAWDTGDVRAEAFADGCASQALDGRRP